MPQNDKLEKLLSEFDRLIDRQEMEMHAKRPRKEVTKDFTWECQRCGDCCRERWGIYVTEEDLRRWMKEKRYDIISEIAPVIRTGKTRFGIMATPEGCIYLTENNMCEIHDTKPETCRIYPFYLAPDGRKVLYDTSCAGVGKGKTANVRQLKSRIRKHNLALERSGHQGFYKLFLKAQRKIQKKIAKSVDIERMRKFLEQGQYDEYLKLDINGTLYHVVSLNLSEKKPSETLIANWIENARQRLQAKAIIGMLRVFSETEKRIIALYCLTPASVQVPEKIPVVISAFMVDARARAASESEGIHFVFWDEFCS